MDLEGLTAFQRNVYLTCSRIKRGRVSTYAEIARAIGNPRSFRAVGNALNKNRLDSVPCHRVVCSNGHIGGFVHGASRKSLLLENEGLPIKNGRIKNFKGFFQTLAPSD